MLERVLFAGGGTGGHVYMAVALAEKLKRKQPEIGILFTGTQQGMETRILPPLGFQLRTIDIGGLKNVGAARAVKSVWQIPRSFLQSRRIVKRFHPSVIAGVGGHSSGPVVLAGRLFGVPSLLIEPNVEPGLTNRLLRYWVDRAAVAFPETACRFGGKARITGIPVRSAFHQVMTPISTQGPLRVLAFGGSQGSRALNHLVCEAMAFLRPEQISIVHQTGPADFGWVRECYGRAGLKAEIVRFIDDMPACFARSDLIISRSGASTVAEIAAAGRPAILIPFPHATDDHQRRNALVLARRGAVLVLEEEQSSGESLARLLLDLGKDRSRLRDMSRAGKSLAQPESVNRIIQLMEELVADP